MVQPFLWIAVVGAFVSFLTGAGVGMNDLSNAFGTTYGAKVLTLSQIVLLASVCEFVGAVSLGGAVTATISGGIAKPADFEDHPYMFMYGMLCACGAAFCWLAIATWLTLPVSSTHSICGGVIGFALVYGGADSVSWADNQDEFPFVNGVAPIVASWFISPLLTGVVAAAIFGSVRWFVLRHANSVQRAILTLPIVVTITFFLEAFFVLFKGAQSRLHWDMYHAAWVAMWIAAGAGVLSCGFVPLLKRRVKKMEQRATVLAHRHGHALGGADDEMAHRGCFDELPVDPHSTEWREAGEPARAAPAPSALPLSPPSSTYASAQSRRADGSCDKVEGSPGTVVREDDGAENSAVISLGELQAVTASGMEVQLYNTHAEMVYRYLQVLTAICASFAHGASDVSNAVGPLAAINSVYQTGAVQTTTSIPTWILCLGGAGLVFGLATFGARLMRLLGEQITVITPSRGFSAELSAALVVSFASGYGIPVSSTHCITGAVVGISMLDVGLLNVRWWMVLKMYGGWACTLVLTAVVSAVFFAQGINAPSR
ncbi:phosphate-repressible phosphate permease [Leishmania donovani]|uniref:Phosphate transporter n=1 Tax=Leishmania donovani TaxID=5661 RepID=A0A3Q8IBK1_LEIDO|nr:phosphate-repressible phosphate permease [Leishmania donovani]AYU78284.1 phosphate-Repressible Phosphate Permease-like protein [Leishmania donovani]TPP49986.1 Phosphate transporter family protein [Leishmania donovani]CBZ33638.1 phosphate-repressible phosphate permease [Leishmania donovani]